MQKGVQILKCKISSMDFFKDNLFVIISTAIIFIPLIRELYLKKNKGMYFWFLVLTFIAILCLGIDKTHRDINKDIKLIEAEDSVKSTSRNVIELRDSFRTFKQDLKEDFHILDSNNKPIIENGYHINIVTINRPRDVIFQ
jgi:hypothetical protein